MPMTPDAFAERLASLMPRLCRAMIRYESNWLTKGRLTLPQFWALERLSGAGPCPMHDLAAALSMKNPAATMMADRLEQLRLVRRVRDPGDRRVVQVELTPRGRTIVRQVHREKRRGMTAMFRALSASEREQYLGLMEKLAGQLSTEVKNI